MGIIKRNIIGCLFIIFVDVCFFWSMLKNLKVDIAEGKNTHDERVQKQKIKRIAFLKIHKTGSSTLACMFLRFGINNNLSIFLPEETGISNAHKMLLLEQGEKYDIFATHTRYNKYFFTHIVQDPAIIALIRRPEKRIISHAFFFKLFSKYDNLNGLSAQNVIDVIVSNTTRYGVQDVISAHFSIKSGTASETNLEKRLMELNSEFLLVLILERINESLILLRRLLNWSFYDILYGAKKTNIHEKVFLNKSQMEHLRSTNKLEYNIYDFFSTELERKISNEGNGFTEELAHFEYVLNQTNVFCQNVSNYTSPYMFPASKWDEAFYISPSDCELIFEMDVIDIKERYAPA